MRHLTAVLLSFLISAAAWAQVDAVSGMLRTQHPFLYVDSGAWDALKARYYNPALPAAGTLTLRFRPGRRLARPFPDAEDLPVIRVRSGNLNLLLVQHMGAGDTTNMARMQISATGGAISNNLMDLPYDEPVTVSLTWAPNTTATFKINGTSYPIGQWSPGSTPNLLLLGRRGDQLDELSLNPAPAGTPTHDLDFQMAWYGLLKSADDFVTANSSIACPAVAVPSGDCAVILNKGRQEITDPARDLAVAYRLTGNPTYLQSAYHYMQRLAAVDVNAGGEWPMASRIAAMGFLYDYLYPETAAVPQGGTQSYRSLLSGAIRATARTAPLVLAACGDANPLAGASFACTQEPAYSAQYNGPTTARYYLSGHAQSANFGTALGLLAIAPDQPEVKPMLDTLYRHFARGFAVALDQVGAEGGYHTGFAYGSQNGELLERLLAWNRAVDNSGQSLFPMAAASTQVYPYIYGLRSDLRFPASGDHFDTFVNNSRLGQLARAAIAAGDPGPAQDFYLHQVRARRGTYDAFSLWEELLYGSLPAGYGDSIDSLQLARSFPGSGQVVMRDRWYDDQATVLDFKSTPFISINHHHMDQNSFALYYKAPLAVDSGVYDDYDSSAHWRSYYRSTIAHNTLIVLDKDAPAYGAQWPGTRPALPYLEEIKPNGGNALDGVTQFEDTPSYAYTQGDASKAYGSTVLLQQRGFVRNLVMLRNPGSQPTVVVYDAVRANGARKATSLLHFTNQIVNPGISSTGQGSGRVLFNFPTDGTPRVFTTRRSLVPLTPIGTMLTTQVLLPLNATIVQAGGKWQGGDNSSGQCPQVLSNGADAGKGDDCRFMAPRWSNTANNWEWVNYVPSKLPGAAGSQISSSDDIGSYRVEISPPAAPADGLQQFLMVLHPQPRDAYDTQLGDVPRARLLASQGECTAVEVDQRVTLVFSRSVGYPSQCSWTAGAGGALLVTGLKRNTSYQLTAAGSGGTASFIEQAGGTQSSSAGTLQVGL